jgi:competence protein ComEA
MNLNREPIKNWFGFTRRERRSTFIMLLIVILIIVLRYSIPESSIAIEDITSTFSSVENHSELYGQDSLSNGEPFSFDPNTASYDTLMKLGLAAKEASTLISYRNKGGKFRQPSDIKKVYGIGGPKAEKLVHFIVVKKTTLEKVRNPSLPPQKSRIDINLSDSATLVRLPGIGPVLSARIIKYRRLLGGFARIDQLQEVYGLPVETFESIKERIFADSTVITRININSAGYKELSRFPYFEKYEVTAILKYREIKGSITGISDLTENKLITKEKAYKVGPYLKFED